MTASIRPKVQIYINPHEPICSDQQCATSSDVVAKRFAETVKEVYEFFFKHFGINGIDGQGKYPLFRTEWDQQNATWTCTSIHKPSCSLRFHDCYAFQKEVVAHEYTHAILDHFTRLKNTGEAGALHESIADVMAIVFKHTILRKKDWKIGNLRDLGERVTMQNLLRTDPHEPDNGHVHDNSRIPSHAFYITIDSLSAWEDRERIIHIWLAVALRLPADATFQGFACGILTNARGRNEPKHVLNMLRYSWTQVGIPYFLQDQMTQECVPRSMNRGILSNEKDKLGDLKTIAVSVSFDRTSHLSTNSRVEDASQALTLSQANVGIAQSEIDAQIDTVSHQQPISLQNQMTQEDNHRLTSLTTLPKHPIYKTENGREFYNPNVTISQLYNHFSPYLEELGFSSGIYIAERMDKFYSMPVDGHLFTALFFKKNHTHKGFQLLERALKTLSYFANGHVDGDVKDCLRKLISPTLHKWGFELEHIGNVKEYDPNSEYEIFILLFYKEKQMR